MFCKKCGAILLPKKQGNKILFACSCGFANKETETLKIGEKIEKTQEKMAVVNNEEENTLPLAEAECPKCGNLKAQFWAVQTRAGDEAETKFFRCTKCKHTWRDYD